MLSLGAAVRTDDLAKDPYAVLNEAREREPTSWIQCLGTWYVTRHCDVLTEPLLRGWYDSFEAALANFECNETIRLVAR
jgi:hypothetical protein